MCCRYNISSLLPELSPLMEEASASPLADRFFQQAGIRLRDAGEIGPMDLAPALALSRGGSKRTFPMRWGFSLPDRAGLLINARSETAGEKPTFREAWRAHRCILPAVSYYEWQRMPKQEGNRSRGAKYEIRPRDSSVTWLCGLYRLEEGLPVFVILTRAPSPDVAHVHDRMPLILPREAAEEWIRPEVRPEDLLPYALTAMTVSPAASRQDDRKRG